MKKQVYLFFFILFWLLLFRYANKIKKHTKRMIITFIIIMLYVVSGIVFWKQKMEILGTELIIAGTIFFIASAFALVFEREEVEQNPLKKTD